MNAKSITIHECGEWMGESVLGLGPAAMLFMGNTLFKNAPNLGSYRKSMDTGRILNPITLNKSDIARRTAILCLTKLLKVDLSMLQDRYGEDANGVCAEILQLHDLGHVKKIAPNVYIPHRNDIALIIFELASFENSEMTRRVLMGSS